MNIPRHQLGRRLVNICLTALTLFTLACSTTGPRVVEVSSRTRLKTIEVADRRYFIDDQASRIRYKPSDLPSGEQREEFYVRWSPASVGMVKFEYRQVAKPNTIFEQTYEPHKESSRVFEVRGEDFRSGGVVSAWRVSLWDYDHLVAEKKSFLW